MGYRKIPTIHTLAEFEGHEGLIVRMKGMSFGKIRRLMAALDEDTKDQDSMEAIAKHVVGSLVSWNLEDEDGTPVPETMDGLDSLDFDLVLEIVNAWLGKMTGPSEDLGKGSAAGKQFPGQPLTMEAL
jgi:hypothetical protein